MALITCKDCQKEFSDAADKCPNCGRPNDLLPKDKPTPMQQNTQVKVKKKGGCITYIIGIFIFIGIIGAIINLAANQEKNSGDKNTTNNTETEENPNLINGKFEIVEDFSTENSNQFAIYISGTLQNTTDRTYSYAQVTFNLYDEDGNQLGTALANINNWEAGGNWKFQAIGTVAPSKVASYKLTDINAF